MVDLIRSIKKTADVVFRMMLQRIAVTIIIYLLYTPLDIIIINKLNNNIMCSNYLKNRY